VRGQAINAPRPPVVLAVGVAIALSFGSGH